MLVSTGVISSRVNLSSARAAVGKLQIQIGATSTGCADVEGHRGIGWAGGCRELNNILDVARRNRLEVHLVLQHTTEDLVDEGRVVIRYLLLDVAALHLGQELS